MLTTLNLAEHAALQGNVAAHIDDSLGPDKLIKGMGTKGQGGAFRWGPMWCCVY